MSKLKAKQVERKHRNNYTREHSWDDVHWRRHGYQGNGRSHDYSKIYYNRRSPNHSRFSRSNYECQSHDNRSEELEILRARIQELEKKQAQDRLCELELELQGLNSTIPPFITTALPAAYVSNSNVSEDPEVAKLKDKIRRYHENNIDLRKKLDLANKRILQLEEIVSTMAPQFPHRYPATPYNQNQQFY